MPWSPDNPVIGEFEDLPVQMLSRSSYFVPADSVPPAPEVQPDPAPLPVCAVSSVLPSDAEPVSVSPPDDIPQITITLAADSVLPASAVQSDPEPMPAYISSLVLLPSDAKPAPVPMPNSSPPIAIAPTVDVSSLPVSKRRTARRPPSTTLPQSEAKPAPVPILDSSPPIIIAPTVDGSAPPISKQRPARRPPSSTMLSQSEANSVSISPPNASPLVTIAADVPSPPVSKRRPVRRPPSATLSLPEVQTAHAIRAYLHSFVTGYPNAESRRSPPTVLPRPTPITGPALISPERTAIRVNHSPRPTAPDTLPQLIPFSPPVQDHRWDHLPTPPLVASPQPTPPRPTPSRSARIRGELPPTHPLAERGSAPPDANPAAELLIGRPRTENHLAYLVTP